MYLKPLILVVGLVSAAASSPRQGATIDKEQTVFLSKNKHNANSHVLHELKHAKIIPQVLDDFTPSLLLNISWGPKAEVKLGNTLKPGKLGDVEKLRVHLSRPSHHDGTAPARHLPANLVLALTDPDARSRENPDWSEMCHTIWGAYLEPNVARRNTVVTEDDSISLDLTFFDNMLNIMVNDGTQPPYIPRPYELVAYKPPAPPPKTGKHRYVWVVLAPANGTTERVYPVAPADRKHWGYNGTRVGVQRWAGENGLAVVGANFFYAKNKDKK